MKVLRTILNILTIIAQAFVYLGAFTLGLLGLGRGNAIEILVSPRYVKTVYQAIGGSALFLFAMKFI